MQMFGRLKARDPYARALAILAVFLVVAGGSAYAGSKIGAGDIKKNAVRAQHIKQNSVRAKHVKKNAVRSKHLKAKAVKPGDLAPGTPTNVVLVEDTTTTTSADKELDVECPGGRLPIGGGATNTSGGSSFVAFQYSRPQFDHGFLNDFNGWSARAIEVKGGTNQQWGIRITVTCARGIAPPGG